MSKIFLRNYKSLTQSIFKTSLADRNKLNVELKNFAENHDIKDLHIFRRFPKREIKSFIKMECPTAQNKGEEEASLLDNHGIIAISKNLRFALDIPEISVCSTCSKNKTCKFANTVPSEKRTSLSELLFFVDVLSKQIKDEDFSSKTANQAEDEKQANKEEKPSDLSLEQELAKKLDEIEGASSELERIVPGKAWMAGLKVLDTLKVVLDDICFEKGENSKFFLNYVHQLDALNQMKGGIVIPAENENDEEFIKPIGEESTQESKKKPEAALNKEEVDEEEYKPKRKRVNSRLNKFKKETSEEIPEPTQQTQAELPKKEEGKKKDAYVIEEDEEDEDFQQKGKREKTKYKDFKKQDNKDFSSEKFVEQNEDRSFKRDSYNNKGKWGDKEDKWGKKSGFDNRERGERGERGERPERRDFQRNRDNRSENNRYDRDNRRDDRRDNREDRGFDRKRGYGSENRRNFDGEQGGNYRKNFQEGEQGGNYKKFMRNTEKDFRNFDDKGGYEKKFNKFDKFENKGRTERKFDGGSNEGRGKKEFDVVERDDVLERRQQRNRTGKNNFKYSETMKKGKNSDSEE